MKTYQTMIGAAVLIFVTAMYAQAQTVRIVNNNIGAPTGTNVYSTLQAAIDAADPDDIIHIIPSPNSYGDATLGKRLKVYGVGHHPEKDVMLTSNVNNLYLSNSGTGPSGDASGSLISGIIGSIQFTLTTDGSTYSNVTIEKCSAEYIGVNSAYYGTTYFDNIKIYMCYIRTMNFSASNYHWGRLTNSLLKNNVFTGDGTVGLGMNDNGSMNNLVMNNIFIRTSLSAYNNTIISNNLFLSPVQAYYLAFGNLEYCMVFNNIFYSELPYGNDPSHFLNNIFNNNITYNTLNDTLPPNYGSGNTGSGNIQGVDPLFVDYPPGNTNFILDNDLHLQTSSPGHNAGTDGTDIGLYGGASPFIFSRSGSTLPVIQSLNTSGYIRRGTNLNVQIKAKGVK